MAKFYKAECFKLRRERVDYLRRFQKIVFCSGDDTNKKQEKEEQNAMHFDDTINFFENNSNFVGDDDGDDDDDDDEGYTLGYTTLQTLEPGENDSKTYSQSQLQYQMRKQEKPQRQQAKQMHLPITAMDSLGQAEDQEVQLSVVRRSTGASLKTSVFFLFISFIFFSVPFFT